MNTISYLLLGLLLVGLPAAAARHAPPQTRPARRVWVTAYYPIWRQRDGTLPPAEIDFTAVSHLVHFAVVPGPDGALDGGKPNDPAGTITPAESAAVIGPAHAAGCRVLLCVGGAASAPLFRSALADAARPRLVAALVEMAVTRGYDGLDIDMEPITDADAPHYEMLIRELRARLDARRPGLLLTAATALEPALFARLQDRFDQINLMTYDLSGPWQGFKTWHNSALRTPTGQTMAGGIPYPSAEGVTGQFVRAGVPRAKLGLGIAFYGDVWSGADGPRQGIAGVTAAQAAYSEIMDRYYQPARYRWDDQAHAPYLTVTAPRPEDRKFISFEDARLAREKVLYARGHGLGGVIIWELGDGYRGNQPPGHRDGLLQAVKQAAQGSLPTR